MPDAATVTTRYGVFLTPDPATCLAVTTITAALRAQYGFVSAGAFPVHATLAGSLPLAVSEEVLIETIGGVVAQHAPFPVQNAGVRVLGSAVIYEVDAIDGAPNAPLRALAAAVDAAVRPLLAPTSGFPADVHTPDRFHAHLSLASHELLSRGDLIDEVAHFTTALPVDVPAVFDGDTVTLYRFEHPTWGDGWWRAMTWDHLHTWRLSAS